MTNRMKTIKEKGFSMTSDNQIPIKEGNQDRFIPVDFSKIKTGVRTLQDANFSLGTAKQNNITIGLKSTAIKAISNCDVEAMRDISKYFYRASGVYNRLCRYMAYMYKYDYFVTPYIKNKKFKKEQVVNQFNDLLFELDNFNVKRFLGEAALATLVDGCYYGYIMRENSGEVSIQELPIKYCRSRFTKNGKPVVEFNMKYFKEKFSDDEYREQILKLFPKEFRVGYKLYENNKLKPTFQGDSPGWYLLDSELAFKFSMNKEDFPAMIAVIPAIIDLDEAQDLDKKKMQQQLLKIIIQKLPLDKNGDLVFDVEEANQLHNNAVKMLSRAIGLDVLTSFADVEVADMNSSSATTATDDAMGRVKANVYDQAGVSQKQFNTDGNLALEKSILNDEASMSVLIQQFEQFLNILIKPFNKGGKKKPFYKVQILNTTIYNYKELSKIYAEQAKIGNSKLLPQVALGQTQSSIIETVYFENEILDLCSLFIPPMSSNTMSAETQKNNGKAGRPKLEDDEKSEKTLANEEALG